jgi:hypothetical protein
MLRLLSFLGIKWTWLALGLLFLGFGAAAYVTARPTSPVEIDATESSYVEVTYNGQYAHNELMLEGNSATYTLDRTSFHPTLPDQVWKQGKIQIWVDQNSLAVIAITLYDENDQNPIKYTTPHYDNPQSGMTDAQREGIAGAVIGMIAIGVFGAWFVLPRRRAIAPIPVSGSGAGLSSDGKWFWDGVQWRRVSADGRRRWDGAQWQELGSSDFAFGAPSPPAS